MIIAKKRGSVVIFNEKLRSIKSKDLLITWYSCDKLYSLYLYYLKACDCQIWQGGVLL